MNDNDNNKSPSLSNSHQCIFTDLHTHNLAADTVIPRQYRMTPT